MFRDYDGSLDWANITIAAVLGPLCLVIISIIFMALIDLVKDYESFNAQVACEARREIPKRQFLSSHVICVSAVIRNDSLTVLK